MRVVSGSTLQRKSTMSSESLFVWIYLPNTKRPVVAARLDITQNATGVVGNFVYGKSYLARENAVPINPVSLPLVEKKFSFLALGGIPGVVLDACPDRWGIKLIDQLIGTQKYPQGYLLLNDPGRSGNLAFSRSHSEPPEEMKSREYPFADLLRAAERVEQGFSVAPELLKALSPGTGGARPKCNVVDSDGVWIAKFPSIDDSPLISIPRFEHAVMTLGKECGLQFSETKLQTVDGRDICLVKRFDRFLKGDHAFRRGFISARSVFYDDENYINVGIGSYARLARWLPKYGGNKHDQLELYKRMVFNCAVRNTDDHELNHGLVHLSGDIYSLSPAYDIVPSFAPHHVHRHALLVGDSAAGTVSNLLSNIDAFGLARDEALSVIVDIQKAIESNWHDVFYEAGFGDEEIRRVEHIFAKLPVDQDDPIPGFRM